MSSVLETPELIPASVGQRVGALVYESVLLFGVVFFVGALTHTLFPNADSRPWVLRAALFVALGAYFTACWHKTGQTLAMKAWQLRLVKQLVERPADAGPAQVSLPRALLRYCAAWTLLAPGIVLVWAFSARGFGAMLVFCAGVLLMLGPALFDRERRLLHDRIAGTRLVRVPLAATGSG